ncbi:hypothetical protein LXL04_034573 [Taraxacum kok-saghyz]
MRNTRQGFKHALVAFSDGFPCLPDESRENREKEVRFMSNAEAPVNVKYPMTRNENIANILQLGDALKYVSKAKLYGLEIDDNKLMELQNWSLLQSNSHMMAVSCLKGVTSRALQNRIPLRHSSTAIVHNELITNTEISRHKFWSDSPFLLRGIPNLKLGYVTISIRLKIHDSNGLPSVGNTRTVQ